MELNNNMKDITGDPKKAVKKLAYPIIIGMLLIMSNNLIDSVWVAGLGPGPLAAIGFVTPLFLILAGIGTGIGAGVNSLISRYVGSKVSSFRYYCFHNSYSYFCSNSRTDTLYHGC